MGDDDWDLYAVVRSCKPAVITTAASSSPKAAHNRDGSAESPRMWDYVKREAVMTYDPPPVGFPNLDSSPRGAGGAFQGLEEFYQPFLPKPSIDHHTNMTTATATTATSSYAAAGSSSITIIPNSPTSFMSDFGGGSNSSSGQHRLQQQRQNNFLPANSALSPHFNPGFSPVSGFGRFLDRHQQPQLETLDGPADLLTPRHKGTVVPFVGPPMPTMQIPPQIIRPKKRNKNQIKKMVCRLTADNLSSDMWAWRKYGQKPIKGSPHPRNYYRCSSTKGCSARKQVERSVEDPDVFVVTYAGDHSHPRPTHRNSLAGSTRNKSASTLPKAKVDGQGQCEDDDEAQAANKNQNSGGGGEKASEEAEDEEIEEEEDDDDEGASMTSEDIFLGMKQLGRTGSGGSTLGSLAVGASGEGFPSMTSNLTRTSWGTNCSLSAGATVDGCGLLGN